MNSSGKIDSPVPAQEVNFRRMVDDAFDRLLTRKAELTLRRIRRLERLLDDMERELDEFIALKGHDG
jgi:hypothetical protein